MALIVGSERYARHRLDGATDATDAVAAALGRAGVETIVARDATRVALEHATREFSSLARDARLAIVVYSGHALTLGESAFVLPTDVDLRSLSDLKHLSTLQSWIDIARTAEQAVVVLDSCHSSSFAAGWGERFGKAPLCAGTDIGFGTDEGEVLTWAVGDGVPRDVDGTAGEFVDAWADEIEDASGDVVAGLRSAAARVTTTGGASAAISTGMTTPLPLVVAAPGPIATGNALVPGTYRLSNLYRSRWLVASGTASARLARGGIASSVGRWVVDDLGDGRVRIGAGGAGDNPLRVASGGGDGVWEAVPVHDGREDEFGLREPGGGRWLVGDVATGTVGLSASSDGTGWLFQAVDPTEAEPSAPVAGGPDPVERPVSPSIPRTNPSTTGRGVRLTVRPTPADARVRILNIVPTYAPGIALWSGESYVIEVSHPAHGKRVSSVRLGEADLVMPVDLTGTPADGWVLVAATAASETPDASATVPESPVAASRSTTVERPSPQVPETLPITAADRVAVLAKLGQVRDAIEGLNGDRLRRLTPRGPEQLRLLSLIEAYDVIDVEIFYLRRSADARRLSAVLRVVSLTDGFGDAVTPGAAFRDTAVHAERIGRTTSAWSTVRWGSGEPVGGATAGNG